MKSLYLLLFFSCVSCITSKVLQLPTSASEINFNQIAVVNEKKTKVWTSETISEFYVEVPLVNDAQLLNGIQYSFEKNGYKNGKWDLNNQTFSAQRGMRANEWATFTRLYYKINPNNTQVYVQSRISQDGSGGWRENRAKKVAVVLSEYFAQGMHE